MILEFLELTNFRLHRHTNIEFSSQLNYIVGGNGQGKTSLLEAIYYLCTSKNINQAKDQEVVSFNKPYFNIKGKFQDVSSNNVDIRYLKEDNKKQLIINNKSINKASELIGKFPVITLTPSDHLITKGAPADRRKFIDSVISQASNTYLKIIIDYNKILRQRSSLLFQIRETNNFSLFDQLESWTELLVKNGTEIIQHRKNFLETFSEYIKKSYKKIMENDEVPEIEYKYLDGEEEKEIEEKFRLELEENQRNEINRAKNLVGPHRDEILFKVNDLDLRTYGSQGQHKTFQISLRFGEFFYLKDTIGKTPIFLMDDVFGELDAFRAGRISDYMKSIGQAFITLTDLSNFNFLSKNKDDLILKVNKGHVKYA